MQSEKYPDWSLSTVALQCCGLLYTEMQCDSLWRCSQLILVSHAIIDWRKREFVAPCSCNTVCPPSFRHFLQSAIPAAILAAACAFRRRETNFNIFRDPIIYTFPETCIRQASVCRQPCSLLVLTSSVSPRSQSHCTLPALSVFTFMICTLHQV